MCHVSASGAEDTEETISGARQDSNGGEVGRRVNRKACLRRHQVIYLSFQLNISNCLCLDLFGENVQRTDTKDLKVRCVPNHIKIATIPMCRVK